MDATEKAPSGGGERRLGLGLVLLCLIGTLGLGLAWKAPCASGDWIDGRQYRLLCYSDVVPLYATEQLEGGRLPFLDPCREAEGQCDEYPVLTMYAMRLATWAAPGITGFFYANAAILAAAALVVVVCLYLLVGPRALMFALAPTLLIYAFVNWDLLAVALATAATLAFLSRRDTSAGVLLGLGAATKLYPALLVVPFLLERIRQREPDGSIRLMWAAAGTWLAVNLPFALAAPASWWEFFRFNAARPPDWDSLWFIGCDRLAGTPGCVPTGVVNPLSAVLLAAAVVLLWRLRRRRDPGFPRWTFGFPLIVAFLLTNKVYSPQYGLWLLPWFAIALPSLPAFAAFEVADAAVFVTRFSWFGRYTGVGGLPLEAFEAAILARTVVLLWCLVAWVRRPPGDPREPVVRRMEART